MKLLVLNVGSSSVKYRLFDRDSLTECGGNKIMGLKSHGNPTYEDAITRIINDVDKHDLAAVVHRVVHGGPNFSGAVSVTDNVLAELEKYSPFAPLHQSHNLAAIRIVQKLYPDIPQYACFDTAFHHGHDALFDTYALPATLRDQGLRRYGFHGLSYKWIAHVLRQDHPHLASGRVIIAHLGNGSSLCAMKNGKSIDTTMGLTALDGVPMGTRCGSIDPGLVLYLMKDMKLSPDEVENILYDKSGLLGLSGISNDVKTLLESDNPPAAFALNHFTLKVAQAIGALTVSLGGLDGIVFTGGIGENATKLRDSILKQVSHLGNIPHLVIKTNEEWIMAQEIQQVI